MQQEAHKKLLSKFLQTTIRRNREILTVRLKLPFERPTKKRKRMMKRKKRRKSKTQRQREANTTKNRSSQRT